MTRTQEEYFDEGFEIGLKEGIKRVTNNSYEMWKYVWQELAEREIAPSESERVKTLIDEYLTLKEY